MRTARRSGCTGVCGAAFRRSASCIENSRSLWLCLLPVSMTFVREGGSAERGNLLQQLVHLDRLGYVVACTLAQAPDAVGLEVLARAHDHGDVLRGRVLRKLTRELETV